MTDALRFGPRDSFPEWFAKTAAEDAEMVWAKAREYGDLSLQMLALNKMVGMAGRVVGEEDVLAFNAAQKLARILDALGRDQEPSADCWRDLACYAMIARRVRETKSWPA